MTAEKSSETGHFHAVWAVGYFSDGAISPDSRLVAPAHVGGSWKISPEGYTKWH